MSDLQQRVKAFLTTADMPPRTFDASGKPNGFEKVPFPSIKEIQAYDLVRALTDREAKLIELVKPIIDMMPFIKDKLEYLYQIVKENGISRVTVL